MVEETASTEKDWTIYDHIGISLSGLDTDFINLISALVCLPLL